LNVRLNDGLRATLKSIRLRRTWLIKRSYRTHSRLISDLISYKKFKAVKPNLRSVVSRATALAVTVFAGKEKQHFSRFSSKQDNAYTNMESVQCISIVYSIMFVQI